MTPKHKQLLDGYLPYLNDKAPTKGKKRTDLERALMVGALAHATATDTQDAYLTILLMSGRVLSEEMK
jgi:hypothetical protein